MPACHSRAYRAPHDLQNVLALLRRCRPPERMDDYPGLSDLQELLSLPHNQANTRLWQSAGDEPLAFAVVDGYNNLIFEIDPLAGDELAGEIVAWGAAQLRQMQPDPAGEMPTLDASCPAGDAARIALLERHGFVQQAVRSLRLERRLDEPLPEAVLPAGFSIRPLRAPQEIEAWVALHRAAFGTQHMTVAERQAMMSGADYDPLIDLVVEAPDGSLAASCVCWINREENALTGHTDPLATHPAYQRRGLARALLAQGMQLLKARGMQVAALGTSSENAAMLAAARAAGFQLRASTVWFARPI